MRPSSRSRRGKTRSALAQLGDATPLAAGAAVMATRIVSIGLDTAGHGRLSTAFFVLACAGWVALAAILVDRLVEQRARLLDELSTPAAFTTVVGTAVLGQRLLGLDWPATRRAPARSATWRRFPG
jgi:hypothetical protein